VPDRDLIETYLDELARALQVHGPRKRRILAEAEQHLRECAAAHGPDLFEAFRREVGKPGSHVLISAVGGSS